MAIVKGSTKSESDAMRIIELTVTSDASGDATGSFSPEGGGILHEVFCVPDGVATPTDLWTLTLTAFDTRPLLEEAVSVSDLARS